jgi:ACS family glucarate transporter-like MFS transporter
VFPCRRGEAGVRRLFHDVDNKGEQCPTRVRGLIFVLACAVSWLLYLHRYSWGVIKPALKRDYPELGDLELGWLDALFNATYALGQVPGGLAGDLCGARLVLTLLIVLWSGSVAWLAWATRFAQMAFIRSFFGLAQAGAYPTLSQVTRHWFPPASRTTVQGAVASLSGRAGGACASLVVATLLMGLLHLSWRTSLLLIGGAGILLGLVFGLLFRNGPRQHPWANEAEAELIEAGPGEPAGKSGKARLRLAGGGGINFAALLLYAFTSTFADQLYVFWIPLFLVEGKGLSPVEMGLFAGLPLWGGAVGGTVGGALNDVLIRASGSRRLGRSSVAFSGKLLAGVLIAASLTVADGRWVMVLLLGCKFFGDWSLPTQWGTITDIGGRASGTVFGTVNMVGAVAAFLAGPAMAHLKQTSGWDGLFLAVAGAYVLAASCWLLIDCTRPLFADGSS